MTPRQLNFVLALAAALLLFVGTPWLMAQLRTLPAAGALSARSSQRIVSLEVAGMTCDLCTERVRTALASTPGVRTVEVRRAQSRAYVVCDAGVADSTLIAAVRGAGPSYWAAVAER
jgi:copper chaperone CopZ